MGTFDDNIPDWWFYIRTREEGSELEGLPFVDDYGLSVYIVKEYWNKIRSIQEKWWKRLNKEKLLLRLGFSISIVFPIVGYITDSFWIGFMLFVIHCLGEYIIRKLMIKYFRKELKLAEIPMIEKYLHALWAWSKKNN